MSAVSILSTWKWECEGHPHLSWQTQNIVLVNKLIFWKVTICFKFFSSSCHLESEMECHFTRQGCRQSCLCAAQHSLTELPAWLGCHGLLLAAGSGQEGRLIPGPTNPACWKLALCPPAKHLVVQGSNYLPHSLLCCCWCLFDRADVGFTKVLPLFSFPPVREEFWWIWVSGRAREQ